MKNTPLWTAIVTPMLDDGAIDWKSFETLLKQQEEAKNGVVLLGSTGEGLALDEQEKREVVKFGKSLNLSIPLMVGVGGFNLKNTLEWVGFCEEQKVDSLLLVTPLYAKPGPRGQTQWFKALLDRATVPCMLYNIPSRAGTSLHLETVNELKGHKNFWAIKEASGSIEKFEEYRETAPDIDLFSGDDALLPYFAYAGAKGLVSVISNVWPKAARLYTEKTLKGETQGLFPLWQKASSAMFCASNPIPAKRLLFEKGVIKTPVLRAPLTDKELSNTDLIMSADKMVNEWLKENS